MSGNTNGNNGEITLPRKLGLKTVVGLIVFMVALSGHAAVLDYRVGVMEERTKEDTRKIEKMGRSVCAMCVELLGSAKDCPICES